VLTQARHMGCGSFLMPNRDAALSRDLA
jgi:hypothetical protein